MPCMCGDLACWSCGPAQGAPPCYYMKGVICGDPNCECAEQFYVANIFDHVSFSEALEKQEEDFRREAEAEAAMYAEWEREQMMEEI